MQQTSVFDPGHFAALLSRICFRDDLDRMAREHGAIVRKRKISSGATLLRLALARGPGGLSLRDAAGWAGMMDIAEISNPGVKYRLDQSAGFLSAVMVRLLEAKAASHGLRWHGRTLRLADGTCIKKPGSKGTDWRVHAIFDLGRGGFSHLELTDGKGAEALTRGAPISGEVRIGDRGYCKAPALRRLRQGSGMKADFIVRVAWNGFRLTGQDGKPFDLISHLQDIPTERTTDEVNVQARLDKAETLPLRLIVLYRPPLMPTLPASGTVGIARRAGGWRRAKQRLIPTVILYDRWYDASPRRRRRRRVASCVPRPAASSWRSIRAV